MAEWLSLAGAVAAHVHDGDTETEPLTGTELAVLRDLRARTAAAHGVQGEAA